MIYDWLRKVFGLLLFGGCCLILSGAIFAEPLQPLKIICSNYFPRLECHFRPQVPMTVRAVQVVVDATEPVSIANWEPYTPSPATNVILWLIDTSNPARQDTIERQTALLGEWLEETPLASRHRLGLARFADSFQVLASPNGVPEKLSSALKNVQAEGQSTAFYRSLLDGIRLLGPLTAERKSLWVFSDAVAEDTAYRHEDVVKAAREAGVVIIGLGYPERESQRPALQRLQRLAEETGGHYMAVAPGENLPPGALATILEVVDGGGRISHEFAHLRGEHRIMLRLHTAEGHVYQRAFTVEGPPAEKTAVAPETEPAPPSPDSFPWIPVIVSTLIAGGLLWSVWRITMKRRSSVESRPLTLARFEMMDSARVLNVHTPICRIGRARDNDLWLAEDSVSAYHAELQRHRDGTFTLSDLGSTNGLWVNGKQKNNHNLRHGDVVELGDVRLRFLQGGGHP